MTNISSQALAEKLLVEGYSHASPLIQVLSDPIIDTYMVVTLDQLQPYEFDPRLTRNPLYDEIKASILERGLDAPPSITRRPGATHFIIRNGGNTRLTILNELWNETNEERFWRIGCLFRPWPERGEIIALTGHLAENELHGGLSFVERALGVEKARELYEQEQGKPLSQSELSRRLKCDGYPVSQPHISRMQETVQYLLPAIPCLLYGGLGRHQIEQLTGLRRACARLWQERASAAQTAADFTALFQEVLAQFDNGTETFSVPRIQDELIGHMSEHLNVQYDTLAVTLAEAQNRWQILTDVPTPSTSSPPVIPPRSASVGPGAAPTNRVHATPEQVAEPAENKQPAPGETHVVSPTETSERVQSIQRLVAHHLGEVPANFEENVVHAVPVQAGGLYPISDVWYIEPTLDNPERLRLHIVQLAREIAAEAGQQDAVQPSKVGLGFGCEISICSVSPESNLSTFSRAVLRLLNTFCLPCQSEAIAQNTGAWTTEIAPLLLGGNAQPESSPEPPARLSDAGLVKLFRLLRLGRRLIELEAGTPAM